MPYSDENTKYFINNIESLVTDNNVKVLEKASAKYAPNLRSIVYIAADLKSIIEPLRKLDQLITGDVPPQNEEWARETLNQLRSIKESRGVLASDNCPPVIKELNEALAKFTTAVEDMETLRTALRVTKQNMLDLRQKYRKNFPQLFPDAEQYDESNRLANDQETIDDPVRIAAYDGILSGITDNGGLSGLTLACAEHIGKGTMTCIDSADTDDTGTTYRHSTTSAQKNPFYLYTSPPDKFRES